MNALAGFIMKGRGQATLALSGLTILSWLLSPASVLGVASLALPALRLGAKESLLIGLYSLLIVSVAGEVVMGNGVLAGGSSLALWLPTILVALILRETANLVTTVLAVIVIGMIAVAGFYLVVSDPPAFWNSMLMAVMKPMLDQQSAAGGEAFMAMTMKLLPWYATGAVAAGFMTTIMAGVLIGRWWQASLYNPGGFRLEFYQLSLPPGLSLVVAGILIVMYVSPDGVAEFFSNLLPVLFMVYVMAGFAVIHAICSVKKTGRLWLFGIYLSLMFAPTILGISIIGLTDAWFDWRKRFAQTTDQQ